ncbi:hypothetical protein [Erwinia sp. E_sp_B04_7]|uniref:hypothetical protein n=1 Tax=unclassified Erwinia TaxID=2622719 RepID=UPI0030CC8AE3
MHKHDTNEERKKEGDVHKGLPEAAPNAVNPYEEDDFPSSAEQAKQSEKPTDRE